LGDTPYYRYYSPALRHSTFLLATTRATNGDRFWPKRSVAALASSLDAFLLDHAPGLQEPLSYLFDALSVRLQS
jgi:hypothetical protein